MDMHNLPHTIWLTWTDQMDVQTGSVSRIFSPVADKANARGAVLAEVNRIMEAAESFLRRELPGYEWSIEPDDDHGPVMRYLIRGDRKT